MKTISVAELHEHTASWIEAARLEPVLISANGQPVVRLEPWAARTALTLESRKLRPGFARLIGQLGSKSSATDVTQFISEERDER